MMTKPLKINPGSCFNYRNFLLLVIFATYTVDRVTNKFNIYKVLFNV